MMKGEKGSGLVHLLIKIFFFLIFLTIFALCIASLVIVVNVNKHLNTVAPYIVAGNNQNQQQLVSKILNIPLNPAVSSSDAQKFAAYSKAVAEFNYSVDFTADPCNDFYKYACGNYKKEVSIADMMENNYANMAGQLTSPGYQATVQNSTALTKEKQFFDACKAVTADNSIKNKTLISQNYLKAKVDALATVLGSNFSFIYGGSVTMPSATQLANALGYLSFKEGIDTYITPMVDTNWRNNTQKNMFYIDQNTCEMPKTYYTSQVFPTIVNGYINSTVAVLMTYCIEQGIACKADDLTNKVTKVVYFEQNIAQNYSTDDTTRRQANRNWNPTNRANMQQAYPFVDWLAYIKNIPSDDAKKLVTATNYIMDMMEIAMTTKMSKDFVNFDKELVVNYLFVRLLLDSSIYLPSYASAFAAMPKRRHSMKIGMDKMDKRQMRRRPIYMEMKDDLTLTDLNCISMADDLMQYANGRVFVDKVYPTNELKQQIRDTAGGLIKNIINSFQGMLEQLDWMDDDTKVKALQKTNGVIRNIAFPDWITDNVQLDAYYSKLDFSKTTSMDFYTMVDLLIQFNLYLNYQKLTVSADRHDFQAGPGVVNAWYQPEYNSITLAGGMLQPPFFHQNFPASINYGGIGIVSGHELTHGFDDQGVQWGPTGNLPNIPWMSNGSMKGFQDMATCVINEYNNFCPLDSNKYTPNCINGAQTQGENIADNGGIHAAFRAYRVHIQLDGPDPTLPDPTFGLFSHDQLFFLNYGQIWCEAPVPDDKVYKQLMTDPHSPALYRVFGTIMNFPAFRVAYNCPIGTTYAPVDHCRVWVPNVEN